MFCPQCGTQTEQQSKFCKSCGLKLTDHAQLIAASREPEIGRMSRDEAKRQLRWLRGTRALAISTMLSPLLLMSFALAAAARGPEQEMFAGITFVLASISLCAGGWGLINLLRGGFFKTYRERRIRAEAALLAQPDSQPRGSFGLPPETNRLLNQVEAVSVTEPTTRELRGAPGSSGKIN
ncbi:MAG: zinc ribbon domain-containing protein [Acidobacteria bacterium]|nr:zinc ribbon domain-containing protein [Acidobacteriota bacterium]